jgi:hypothetical protein
MKTDIFFNAPDSAKLNENFAKQFGGKVNLDKYTREQLEDMRNKIRTRVFQQEGSAGYNDLLTNETYQKDQAMLQLLNTRIKEMLGEDIKQLRDKMVELSEAKKGVLAPKFVKKSKGSKGTDQTGDGKSNFDDIQVARMTAGGVPKNKAIAKATSDNVKEDSKPPFPTVADAQARAAQAQGTGKFDKKPNKETGGTIYTRKSDTFDNGTEDKPKDKTKDKKVKEDKDSKSKLPSKAHIKKMCQDGKSVKEICKMHPDCDQTELKKMVADCKKNMVKESTFKHNVRFVNESLAFLIKEDEEGKAKAITAASDMVNDFTSWMQRVGQYQTKAIIELADAIKADFGAQEAETFKQTVAPALSATLETLTAQREAISNAVAVLAGEAAPEEPMGMEPGMDMEPGMEPTEPDMMNAPEMGDEFGASDAAAGGAEPSGREVRESKFARRLAESHSIMAKLAK